MDTTIRVLIVDDHYMVRTGLTGILQRQARFCIVGEAHTGEEAIHLCAATKPDIILMDIVLPGISGIEATRLIRAECPATRIIGLTSFSDAEQAVEAIQAGVNGYLLKNVSGEKLIEAILQVYAGGTVFSPDLARVLANRPPARQIRSLTEREKEILALVVKGLTNQQIALSLQIGQSTVKDHVSRIFTKLQVSNRAEAAALAVHYRLIDPPVGQPLDPPQT